MLFLQTIEVSIRNERRLNRNPTGAAPVSRAYHTRCGRGKEAFLKKPRKKVCFFILCSSISSSSLSSSSSSWLVSFIKIIKRSRKNNGRLLGIVSMRRWLCMSRVSFARADAILGVVCVCVSERERETASPAPLRKRTLTVRLMIINLQFLLFIYFSGKSGIHFSWVEVCSFTGFGSLVGWMLIVCLSVFCVSSHLNASQNHFFFVFLFLSLSLTHAHYRSSSSQRSACISAMLGMCFNYSVA